MAVLGLRGSAKRKRKSRRTFQTRGRGEEVVVAAVSGVGGDDLRSVVLEKREQRRKETVRRWWATQVLPGGAGYMGLSLHGVMHATTHYTHSSKKNITQNFYKLVNIVCFSCFVIFLNSINFLKSTGQGWLVVNNHSRCSNSSGQQSMNFLNRSTITGSKSTKGSSR